MKHEIEQYDIDNAVGDQMLDICEVRDALDVLFQSDTGYDLLLAAIATRIVNGKCDTETDLFNQIEKAVEQVFIDRFGD